MRSVYITFLKETEQCPCSLSRVRERARAYAPPPHLLYPRRQVNMPPKRSNAKAKANPNSKANPKPDCKRKATASKESTGQPPKRPRLDYHSVVLGSAIPPQQRPPAPLANTLNHQRTNAQARLDQFKGWGHKRQGNDELADCVRLINPSSPSSCLRWSAAYTFVHSPYRAHTLN